MSKNTITAAAVVGLLGLAAFWYQRTQTETAEASLALMTKDRNALDQEVKKLSRLVAELRERQVTPATRYVDTAAPATSAASQAVPTLAQRVEPVATPGVSIKAPQGWSANGTNPKNFVVGVDENETLGGFPSAYVKSLEPGEKGFGGMMQTISAENYLGQRVRLSGWMKTEEANDGGGHLWLRVDGQNRSVPLQFDNMNERAPKGTTGWQQYSVVLDVPPDASALAYGFFVQGGGKVLVNGTKLEPVGLDVPSTNMNIQRTASTAAPRKLPTVPANLGFSPGP